MNNILIKNDFWKIFSNLLSNQAYFITRFDQIRSIWEEKGLKDRSLEKKLLKIYEKPTLNDFWKKSMQSKKRKLFIYVEKN